MFLNKKENIKKQWENDLNRKHEMFLNELLTLPAINMLTLTVNMKCF